jgi:hypothetical protein
MLIYVYISLVQVATWSKASRATCLLRSRTQLGAWMFVACCVLSGGGLCNELITRPEESFQMWCVIVTTTPHERGGHSPHWAAEPEKIIT